MQRLQATTLHLAETTSARVVTLWRQVPDILTLEQFRSLASTVIARANAQGVALADVGLSAEVLRQLGKARTPLGIQPTPVQVDQERIAATIDRALALEDPEAELGRMARSEPLLTVATTVQTGMVQHGASGWTRGLSGGSCPLCVGWADGVVRPTSTRMVRHNGCDCIQQPNF